MGRQQLLEWLEAADTDGSGRVERSLLDSLVETLLGKETSGLAACLDSITDHASKTSDYRAFLDVIFGPRELSARAAAARTEARDILRALHLEQAIADALPAEALLAGAVEDPLSGFFSLRDDQIQEVVASASSGIAKRITQAIKRVREGAEAARRSGDLDIGAEGEATMTVEELEAGRKSIVMSMLDTLQDDICRDLRTFTQEERFLQRTQRDVWIDENSISDFSQIAIEGCRRIVDRYQELEPSWYGGSARFAEAVSSASTLPLLARSWVDCYVEDPDKSLYCMDQWNFDSSVQDLRRFRQRELERARQENDTCRVWLLAQTLCIMKGYVRWNDAGVLESVVEGDETPLIEKIADGDARNARLLAEARQDIEVANARGQRPLHLAVERGLLEVVRALLEAKAEIEAEDTSGQRPLHHAAFQPSGEVVHMLVQARAEIEAETSSAERPLHYASCEGRSEMVQILIRAGAQIEVEDARKERPLHYAAEGEVVRILLGASANIEAEDAVRQRPLHCAVSEGNSEVAQLLLAAGAQIEADDKDKETPLHLAALAGHTSAVLLLIEAKANVQARRSDGKTAVELAAEGGRAEAEAVLRQAMGQVA